MKKRYIFQKAKVLRIMRKILRIGLITIISLLCCRRECDISPPKIVLGPTRGRVGVSYGFQIDKTDLSTGNIRINWGDGVEEEHKVGFVFHSYSIAGTFQIKVKAKAKNPRSNCESDWGLPHKIIIGDNSFYDDFSSYPIHKNAPFGEWQILEYGTYYIEKAIQIDNTEGNIFNASTDSGFYNPIGRGGRIFIHGDWTNHSLEVHIKNSGRGEPRVYFRLSSITSTVISQVMEKTYKGYYVTKDPGNITGIQLFKITKDTTGEVKKKIAESAGFNQEGWWSVKIEAKGPSIKVFVGNQEMINVEDNDAPFLSGGIGIGIPDRSGNVYFDNVKVDLIE